MQHASPCLRAISLPRGRCHYFTAMTRQNSGRTNILRCQSQTMPCHISMHMGGSAGVHHVPAGLHRKTTSAYLPEKTSPRYFHDRYSVSFHKTEVFHAFPHRYFARGHAGSDVSAYEKHDQNISHSDGHKKRRVSSPLSRHSIPPLARIVIS